jgi:2-hydroxy-3-keto-5-methylthiopentenyl-1-phosphate phosphatase
VKLAIFVDYDGTITDQDTFDVLVNEYVDAQTWNELERKLGAGSMTLRDVLAAQASGIAVSLDEADALLASQTRIDPTFRSFADACTEHDARLEVVSSGVAPLIERAFARNGLSDVDVFANGVDPSPRGWRFLFLDDSANGHDKAARVVAAREAGYETVFIGDGPSDYDAAIAAGRRFAKQGKSLARYLRGRGVPFTSFASFAEIESAVFEDPTD